MRLRAQAVSIFFPVSTSSLSIYLYVTKMISVGLSEGFRFPVLNTSAFSLSCCTPDLIKGAVSGFLARTAKHAEVPLGVISAVGCRFTHPTNQDIQNSPSMWFVGSVKNINWECVKSRKNVFKRKLKSYFKCKGLKSKCFHCRNDFHLGSRPFKTYEQST